MASSWLGRASPRQLACRVSGRKNARPGDAVGLTCRAHLAAEETKAKDKSRRLSPESSRFSHPTATRETAYKVLAYKTTADLRRWSARATGSSEAAPVALPVAAARALPGAADVLPRRRLPSSSSSSSSGSEAALYEGFHSDSDDQDDRAVADAAPAARRTSNRGRHPSAATRCSRSRESARA